MHVLFVEPKVNNPVRINLALPMTFLALYSYARSGLEDVDFFFHSIEVDEFYDRLDFDGIYKKYFPNVVLCSTVSCNFKSVIDLLKYFKENGCVTILGGIFPTSNDKWVLESYPFIDIVVRGEGEQTLVNILKKLKKSRPLRDIYGITYRLDDIIVRNPDCALLKELDFLPPLSFDKIPIHFYREKKDEVRFYVFASRGCHYKCDFCTLTQHWLNKHREFSVERIILEIEQITNLFSPRQISFGDDTLSLDKKFFEKLCRELAKRQLPIKFGGKTRIDLIDRAYLEMMHDAGFKEISFGIESNDENQLKSLNKGGVFQSLAKLNETLTYASELDFRINLNFILGAPGETVSSLSKKADFIIDHCCSTNIVPLLGFLTPHRGTALYNSIINGHEPIKIFDYDFDHYNHLQPVCIPYSLGDRGIEKLIDTYNKISSQTHSTKYNPLIGIDHDFKN